MQLSELNKGIFAKLHHICNAELISATPGIFAFTRLVNVLTDGLAFTYFIRCRNKSGMTK